MHRAMKVGFHLWFGNVKSEMPRYEKIKFSDIKFRTSARAWTMSRDSGDRLGDV